MRSRPRLLTAATATRALAALAALAALTAPTVLVACAGHDATRHVAAPGALGPYSSAVEAGGFVFVAGKVGRDRESFDREVHSAISAVETELEALGLDLADTVSVSVFVTDIERYAEVNAIYGERFPRPYPARTFVGVDALPGGASIEIQVIARR